MKPRDTAATARAACGTPPVFEEFEPRLLLDGSVVINEIHYDPDVKTEAAEFIELYNTSGSPVDLSHWYFSDGIEFEFPETTSIAGYGYLVVAQDPATVATKFGAAALGPYTGQLSNDGEKIVLRDGTGAIADEVDYGAGFPWPTVGDAPGYSIELINPALDNDLGGNWRRALATGGLTNPVTLIPSTSTWHYRKGTSEPSDPMAAWRQNGFVEDGTWVAGAQAAIGYGETFIKTTLADMQSHYTTVYLRKEFTVTDPGVIGTLTLQAQFDDGFNVWINGVHVLGRNAAGQDLPYTATSSGAPRENSTFETFVLPSPEGYLQAGTNVIAVQVLNVASVDPDCFFDLRLIGSAGKSYGPTPGARNAAYASNAAPQMRQVEHGPNEPVSGEVVTITAKVTDPDGVTSVVLEYQAVDPGNYIEVTDAAYQTNWTSVAMNDLGTGGDATAGDGTYTVQLPASLQVHRRLVRYRITATDALGLSIRGPYADDPQPNFAYFVYDGVPGWSGAVDPDSTDPAKAQVVTYSSDVMSSVPTYQLISKQSSVEHATWIDQYGGDDYLWSGTLVYNGQVYDNIHYRARGGVWRYSMGKNMWKIDFNRNHYFQALDDWGNPYDTTWDKLNLGACIQQGDYGYRGEQGMFESVGFRLFELAGVEASKTSFVQLRIIDAAAEAGTTQYDGDFWGLYLAVEQLDGEFLDEHDLPDGNLYKMEYGPGGGTLNNQGPTAVTDNSDLIAFTGTYSTNPSDAWWRDNLDLERYYSYRAIIEGIHHYDVVGGKNYFYYLNPETDVWSVLPWDLDLTWANTMYGDGNEPIRDKVLPRAAFNVEYQNRLREIRDLLFNTDQAYLLINEYAAMIDDPAGGLSIVDADRAMWDYNPLMSNTGYPNYVNLSKAGEGRFYQASPTKSFRGMVQLLKDYVVTRSTWIDTALLTNESVIPAKPTVTYIGPAGHPGDELQFQTSDFTSSYGNFGAMEWRIAEVTPAGGPDYDPANPKKYEIEAAWESGELTIFDPAIAIPSSVIRAGATYRVRVRMRDTQGRYSHWSDAAEFVVGPREGGYVDLLRITEVMYSPPASTPDEVAHGFADKEAFEYVEIQNTGDHPLYLEGVQFNDGITYTFGQTSIGAGQYLVLARNPAAFQFRYPGIACVGPYDGGLKNDGEHLCFEDPLSGVIQEFTYKDGWFDQTNGEGFSLVIRDPLESPALWGTQDGWKASWTFGGNPGEADTGYSPGDVVINEVMAHQDTVEEDWIELHNTTGAGLSIGGWYLSDDALNLMKYRIAPGTVIPDGGYVVFTETASFGEAATDEGRLVPFALSELGDDVYLTASPAEGVLGGYREDEHFGASDNGVTLGRYIKSTGGKDFTALVERTPWGPNAAPVVEAVVINEIMYGPAAGGYEFIELYNRSDAAVLLYDPQHSANTWQFTDGVLFAFPSGASIAAHGYALVVGVTPAEFLAACAVPPGVNVYGPYTGLLDNAGETLELKRPGPPEVLPPYEVPYIRVDRVTYDNEAPWPTGADGLGPSLERITAGAYGNDVANWRAAPVTGGTPGDANSVPPPPPHVTAVRYNDIYDRTVSAIDPSGVGVRTIEITFSANVVFQASSVVIQKVTFEGNTEIPGAVLTPASVAGTGTGKMTVTFATAAVVDTWVKVKLRGDGALVDAWTQALDGEAKADGSGRGYVYSASADLPTGDGTAGGDTIFYVGSLRGDMRGVGFFGFAPDGVVNTWDINGFTSKYAAGSLDADMRGVGFFQPNPDGLLNVWDINGFASVYSAAVRYNRHLDPLPTLLGGPLASGLPQPLEVVVSDPLAATLERLAPADPEAADLAPPLAAETSADAFGGALTISADATAPSTAWTPADAAAPTDATLSPDGDLVDLLAQPALEVALGA